MNIETIQIIPAEGGKEFVGLKYEGNIIKVFYPEAYHWPTNTDGGTIAIDNIGEYSTGIKNILQSIRLAKKQSSVEELSRSGIGQYEDFAFPSYVWIMNDYFKNGCIVTNRQILKRNQTGKINWKKTLSQMPLISENSCFYKDVFVSKNESFESILTTIYRYCVQKSIHLIGWLYGVTNNPFKFGMESELQLNTRTKALYEFVLKKALSNTFNDIHTVRLSHMLRIVSGLNEVKDGFLAYGVDSYHFIFEKMIDHIFGNEDISKYKPFGQWFGITGSPIPASKLEPDSILKSGLEYVIIDAKYYRHFLDDAQNKDHLLPQTDSIQKQLTYGDRMKVMLEESNLKGSIYNCFILPYDKYKNSSNCFIRYSGIYAEGNWRTAAQKENSYDKIYVVLIDMNELIDTYLHKSYEDPKKTLLSVIKNTYAHQCPPLSADIQTNLSSITKK